MSGLQIGDNHSRSRPLDQVRSTQISLSSTYHRRFIGLGKFIHGVLNMADLHKFSLGISHCTFILAQTQISRLPIPCELTKKQGGIDPPTPTGENRPLDREILKLRRLGSIKPQSIGKGMSDPTRPCQTFQIRRQMANGIVSLGRAEVTPECT